MFAALTWEPTRPPAEQSAITATLTRPGLLQTTLKCLHGVQHLCLRSSSLSVRYLATGGAKQVYLVTVHTPHGGGYDFVLKQFLPIRLTHLPPGVTVGGAAANAADLDDRLLDRMLWAARRLDALAPGLCPRVVDLWQWSDMQGQRCRAMTEAYVAGQSLERWKGLLEERFVQGEIDFRQAAQQRQALERQSIAAYVRLWDVLGRCTFTSDPSPWNVLFTPTEHGLQPSIIDLHSIHDGGTPLYVFQTLEAQFGNRDDMLQKVLCPGIVEALGSAEGRRFLEGVRTALEGEAAPRQHIGLSPYTGSMRAISQFLAALPDGLTESAALI